MTNSIKSAFISAKNSSRSHNGPNNLSKLRRLAADVASGWVSERDARIIAQTTLNDPDTGRPFPPGTFSFRITNKGDKCEFTQRRLMRKAHTDEVLSEFREIVQCHDYTVDRRAQKVRDHEMIKFTKRNPVLSDGLDNAIKELMLTK